MMKSSIGGIVLALLLVVAGCESGPVSYDVPTGKAPTEPIVDAPFEPARRAQGLVDVFPVTDSILALYFEEGWIDYHDIAGTNMDDVPHVQPLDVDLATDPASYVFESTDERFMHNAGENAHPLAVGRKTKGIAFSGLWPDYPYASGHWIYLQLPEKMRPGHRYEVMYADAGLGAGTVSLIYDEQRLRSESVHVNQLGYAPGAPQKYAYIYAWLGDLGPVDFESFEGNRFYLVEVDTGERVFEGQVQFRMEQQRGNGVEDAPPQGFYASDVWECDFSTFDAPGEYVVVVEGVGRSFPFEISEDVHFSAFSQAMFGLYHHRSGPARDPQLSPHPKPVDHVPGVNGFDVIYSEWRYSDGVNAFEELPEYATDLKMPDAWGGWFDAGDWDRNINHLDISYYLSVLYQTASAAFTDGQLRIPEDANGVPDILDEAMWGVDLFVRLKGPTGGISGGLEATGHPRSHEVSSTDSLQWYQYAEEPWTTFLFAKTAAELASALRLAGQDELARGYTAEAEAAYEWAIANTVTEDEVLPRGWPLGDSRMAAAASLLKATGDLSYEAQYMADNKVDDPLVAVMSWGSRPLKGTLEEISAAVAAGAAENDAYPKYRQRDALYAYVTADVPGQNAELVAMHREALINHARFWNTEPADLRASRVAYDWFGPSVVGIGHTTPQIIDTIMAYRIADRETQAEFMRTTFTTVDYFLGGNPLNTVWMTGLGERSPQEILHVDSRFDDVPDPIPGVVPYGVFRPKEVWFNGPWSPGGTYASAWPMDFVYTWPVHELYFENRYSAITNEYTVHQNIGPAAAAYGFAWALATGAIGSAE